MDNLIFMPTGKNYQHCYPKKPGPNLINFIWDKGLQQMTKKQVKLIDKRIEIADQILKYLPDNKKHLLEKYDDLFTADTQILVDRAIKWTLEHEAEIKEEMGL